MRSEAEASNANSEANHTSVSRKPVRVLVDGVPLRVVTPSLGWRALELFHDGKNTVEIAAILEAARLKRPGSNQTITEAKVYKALNNALDSIYERGLTYPRVSTVGKTEAKEGVKP